MLGTKPNKDFPYFSAAWKKTNKGLSGLKLEDGNNTSITIWEFGNPREELLKSETNKKLISVVSVVQRREVSCTCCVPNFWNQQK